MAKSVEWRRTSSGMLLTTMNKRFAPKLSITPILFLLFAAGCATQKPAPKNYIFFPPAPEEPRIQYLTSFGSETDLGGPNRFNKFVVGEEKVYRPIWKPYGLTIRNGKVYVCDTQAGHVNIADISKAKMTVLKP